MITTIRRKRRIIASVQRRLRTVPGAPVSSRVVNSAYLPAGHYWGVPEIAEFLGINQGTVRDYISDPDREFPEGIEIGGRKVYRADAVRKWHADRPGRGKPRNPRNKPTAT